MSSSKATSSGLKRPHTSSSSNSSSKKPRFSTRNPSALTHTSSDSEPDAILDADVIGPRGPVHKRNAVNIDGYDSDSDHDNFDRRAAEKLSSEKAAKREKSRLEEDNDMFADLKDDFADDDNANGSDEEKSGKKKKKGVRFVDSARLMEQGAEDLSSKSGGHVSADFTADPRTKYKSRADSSSSDSSEEEDDDETRAAIDATIDSELGAGSKKSHTPKLDAFNMRDEQETGAFDDQGNYIRKATDPDAVHDSWLEGLGKKEIKSAKLAAEKRDEERRRKDIENDSKSISDVLGQLIPLLQRGETVLEALARIGKGKPRQKKWQMKQKNRKPTKEAHMTKHDEDMTQEDPLETKRRHDVEAITAAADLLLTKGQTEIYDTERELLVRQYTRETGEQWVEEAAGMEVEDDLAGNLKAWEYRWFDARDGGNINGPYDGMMMKQWNEAGYFGEGVEFRETGSNDWSRVADF